MTLDEVTKALEAIGAVRGDDERAHSQEDDLWKAVLEAIADGAPNAAELAREALKSADLEFERWCA